MILKALLLSSLAAAPVMAARVDDSDLAGASASRSAVERLRAEGRPKGTLRVFPLSSSAPRPGASRQGSVSGSLFLTDAKGADRPARLGAAALIGGDGKVLASAKVGGDGSWSLQAPVPGALSVRFSLDNSYWSFSNPRRDGGYAWESRPFELAPGGSVELGALRPEPGSENAKLGLLHLTYLEALDYFARQKVATGWWTRALAVRWPSDGDYFDPTGFELNITRAEAWDVDLHEFGHAVMAASMRAAPAGGRHKIDECYSPALAWSEGWATFFAAAVHLDPSDPDARFEFLVPRRAPIRIENVPDDVCKGQSNEWRVAGALWDLLDLHEDGSDRVALPFAELWKASENASMASLLDYFRLLLRRLDPKAAEAAREALAQNTIPESRSLSFLPPKDPAFDGGPR